MSILLGYRGAPSSVPVLAYISIWVFTSSSTSNIFSFSAFRLNFLRCDFDNPSSLSSSARQHPSGTFHNDIDDSGAVWCLF